MLDGGGPTNDQAFENAKKVMRELAEDNYCLNEYNMLMRKLYATQDAYAVCRAKMQDYEKQLGKDKKKK